MATPRNVVVVGASAGGVEALTEFVAALPVDLPAAVLVVLHVAPGGTSVLPGILNRAGRLPAAPVGDGELLQEGRVYVAVPDRHLVVEDGILRLPRTARENGHRPAVDTLFRSAARTYGANCTAVVLSGARDDGTAGAAAVRAAGGRVLVQEADDALYPSMPASVLVHVGADGAATAPALGTLVAEALPPAPLEPMSGGADDELDRVGAHEPAEHGASGLTCPECGGAIWMDELDGVVQLNCHTGHAYSPASFAAEQDRVLENALWSAVRHLEERAGMLRRLATRIEPGSIVSGRFETTAREAQAQAAVIRELISSRTAEAS